MKIVDKKSETRQFFKARRIALQQTEVINRSQKISENFIKNLLPNFLSKKPDAIFSLYLPTQNEVSTSLIAEHLKKNNISLSYPKIIQKNQPLEFILDEGQSLVPSIFFPKILELSAGKKVIPDFIILPLTAFDSTLSRLGMGGGFFDRTIQSLKTQKSEIITIGLAYDFQRADEKLPTEITDQKLDFVATEQMIFSAS